MTKLQHGILLSAVNTVRIEQNALSALALALQQPDLCRAFAEAVAAIAATRGRLIVTGMGKSGIIGRKIAATMTSTGTPSLFIHPAEASHGDLGMITPEDIVLAVTWSGETTELGDIIAYCRRFGAKLIVVTSRADSTAGRAADICLTLPLVREACPNQLAPTSSTTLQAVLGDALAVALIEERGFSESDFLLFHPGGRLGAQLTTVEQIMGTGPEIPVIHSQATLMDATVEMSRKRYGGTAVVDDGGRLVGAFTDGDLRRAFASGDLNGFITDHMSVQPLSVAPTTLLPDALRIMNDNAVSVLFVCEADDRLVGVVHLHDMLRAGIA
ncbi:KpsF/GutQ family sugar-phosphate isomerase [Sphingomonas morindae]|uniref:KpsF/GutQ family sugar-phosphate isomerase n=1 Tax=Sphingomonas morindae TaxID=1541170 RepID=A0ABY4X6B5_9SPHN|nr:KpsF/GutQ family sugar-phosphate isomerase [Sphingomonas morindae]USI72375.1 KpsF/GutQ family sugar-phosphate isomerase [Sphingomonas morindae]